MGLAGYTVGERIGQRYEVVAPLQAGSMGAVYRALDLTSGREVAVKVLLDRWRARRDLRERFSREALALREVRHPHVVGYCDHGHDDQGRPFLVTELLEGDSGLAFVEREPAPTPAEVVRVVAQLCAGLALAHEQGIVHRDLKWSNVIIAPGVGEPRIAKVIDFGILKYADDAQRTKLTSSDVLLGTPEYVSPELILGEPADGRSDLYGLAIMTWEALVGARPFQARRRIDLLRMHVDAPPPPLAGRTRHPVPDALEAAVLRGLAKAPPDRQPTVTAFAEELEQALHP